jgi:hypothetical protein
MHDSFEKVVGAAAEIDAKRRGSIFSDVDTTIDDAFGDPVTDDIHKLLASFEGHDRRLDAFRAMQN